MMFCDLRGYSIYLRGYANMVGLKKKISFFLHSSHSEYSMHLNVVSAIKYRSGKAFPVIDKA